MLFLIVQRKQKWPARMVAANRTHIKLAGPFTSFCFVAQLPDGIVRYFEY